MTEDVRAALWPVAAVLWAMSFGALHLVWAAGGRFALVDPAAADAAFEQGWFQMYNLAVAAGSFLAASAAFTLTRDTSGAGRVRHLVVWLTGGLLLVRGGVGTVEFAWTVITQQDQPLAAWSVDLFMLAGGVLFAVTAMHAKRRRRRGSCRPAR